MWLVLCSATDQAGIWVYERLRARGLDPLELVTAEVLSAGLRWCHRLDSRGVDIEVELADGREIRSDDVRGVVNRIVAIPNDALRFAKPPDAEYAEQEIYSFYMSWLYSLPRPLLNPPTPQGLSGRWRHVSEWANLASRAGLQVPVTEWGHDQACGDRDLATSMRLRPVSKDLQMVFVVDGKVVGRDLTEEEEGACALVAVLSETPLLAIELVRDRSGWMFNGASANADLRLGGEPLADALFERLIEA